MTQPQPPRIVTVEVWNSFNTAPLGYLLEAGGAEGLRIRRGIGATERLEMTLPRRLGLTNIPNELFTTGELALGNYVRVTVSDWRTLTRQQADAASFRSGSAETDLARTLWTGVIRAIASRPEGITVTAVEPAAGTAAGGGVAHHIGYGCLLDWNLEVSDYRSPGVTDYTGSIEIAHDAYDTSAITLGDTITVGEGRVLNVDSNTRYSAYSDSPRTVHSLEWTARGLTIQFDARTPDLVNDQLLKLTEMTRSATTNTVTAGDQFVASGGLTTKTVALAPTDWSVGTPSDGTIILDSTNARLYVRSGGVWKYATLT